MGNFNGFRGSVGTAGAVQTTYNDQPGVAVPGMLAFASDLANTDGIFIGGDTGIAAGRGVVFSALAQASDLQRPNLSAVLPTVATAAGDLDGILVFDETMQSDSNGVPGWNPGRVGRILRPAGAGGRVYLKAVDAFTLASTVNLVTVAGTDGKYQVGEFAPAALAGDATHGTSVACSNGTVEAPAAAGGVVLVNFKG
jgi:hypothetical protein